MSKNSARVAGRHFLQIPGPTPVPDRILRAMDMPVLDHRGPEFQKLGRRVLDGMKRIFRTEGRVFIYPASGTGAWEAALVNTLSQGDRVLMFETGHFATLWKNMALKLGLQPEFIEFGLARRRRCGGRRGAAARRPRACHQSRLHRPQRDLDGMRLRISTPSARRSTRRGTRRFSSSTPSRRSPRSTTATTNGASTSPSPARRRGSCCRPASPSTR